MAGKEPARELSRNDAEEQLLIQAAQADPARFGELYETHFELVYAFIARRVRDRDAAEDLTSQVFQKALEYLPRFRWRGVPFAAWLLKIASNMVADRSKKLAKEQSLNEADEPTEPRGLDLEAVEQQALLFQLVGKLADDQRRVVEMRFAEEKSIREIAQDLGRSEGAVKQLQFRALKNLRLRLAEQLGVRDG